MEQGEALSMALFYIVLLKVIRNIETNTNGTIFNRTRQYIARADEVIDNTGRMVSAREVATHINEAGLVILESKTKYIKINRNIIHFNVSPCIFSIH